jgi:hypothetical protein
LHSSKRVCAHFLDPYYAGDSCVNALILPTYPLFYLKSLV